MQTRPTPSNPVLLWRGATRACPACGQRGLTRGVAHLVDECPRCGFVFERKPGHFTGAVGVSSMLTGFLSLVAMMILLVITWPDLSLIGLGAVPMAIAIVFPIVFHPTAKTFWAGMDLMMVPLEPGEAVADLAAAVVAEAEVIAQEGASEER